MDRKPRLLDLYCKAGGAARGYQQAGFEVVGVDYEPQPRYAGDHFILGNAIAAMDVLLCGGSIGDGWRLSDFDAIHASPPCQGYSIMRNLPWLRDKVYPLLIEPTREALTASGLPFIIENVAGARYRKSLPEGLRAGWLCGQMFGIPILRHRYFETNFPWLQPGHGRHWGTIRKRRMIGSRANDLVTALGNGAQKPGVAVGHAAGVGLARDAMQIDWMTRDELSQAIPPVMTAFLGKALLAALRAG